MHNAANVPAMTVYAGELGTELASILRFWMDNAPDQIRGGFFGRIDSQGKADPTAPRGLVLNSRILWTFSAAYLHRPDPSYLSMARRAYDYLVRYFLDREYGGAFWSLEPDGKPLDDRKQIYGLAFCLYGLSEFYRATRDAGALQEAIAIFRIIERYSFDRVHGGYEEAYQKDWQALTDWRLSDKDANEKKTMNTQLHVLEAYSNLYRCWQDKELGQQIAALLKVFDRHIMDAQTHHLGLFFADDWTPRSMIFSYGHDIEAAWLLYEAAAVINDQQWIDKTRLLSVQLAEAAAEGLDGDGGLWYESEGDHWIREKHWWPQAEAMIGFFHLWEMSGSSLWLQRSRDSWAFVKKYIRDAAGGEWWWGVRADHEPMPDHDKAGFWKCPYHNSRACLEILRRLRID